MSSADFFQNQLFRKILSEILSGSQKNGSRSGPIYCWALSGFKLFSKVISGKELIEMSLSYDKMYLSYDVSSGSEITPCNKIDKPLVVYRFLGNAMMSITTLRT